MFKIITKSKIKNKNKKIVLHINSLIIVLSILIETSLNHFQTKNCNNCKFVSLFL